MQHEFERVAGSRIIVIRDQIDVGEWSAIFCNSHVFLLTSANLGRVGRTILQPPVQCLYIGGGVKKLLLDLLLDFLGSSPPKIGDKSLAFASVCRKQRIL